MRCEAHGLALGPDGRCVLCREAERGEAPSSGRVSMLVAGVGVVAAAALAVYVARPKPTVSADGPPQIYADGRSALAAKAGVVEAARDRPISAGATERVAPTPTSIPFPASRTPVSGAVDAGLAPTVVAAMTAPTPPSDAAIQAALRATPIVMFATSWCPACKRARAFLDANGLAREEKDVDHDERARAELKRLTGKGSIPAFLVDGELVRGFSEESMTSALVASVEKRLAFKGIRVRTAEMP